MLHTVTRSLKALQIGLLILGKMFALNVTFQLYFYSFYIEGDGRNTNAKLESAKFGEERE